MSRLDALIVRPAPVATPSSMRPPFKFMPRLRPVTASTALIENNGSRLDSREGQLRAYIVLVNTAGVGKILVVLNKMDDPAIGRGKARLEEFRDKRTPASRVALSYYMAIDSFLASSSPVRFASTFPTFTLYGMYATRTIAAGELIVAERPLLVAPGAYSSQLQRNDTIAAALARMSADDRAAYTAPSNAYDAAMPSLFAIWQTNNYDVTHDLRPVAPKRAADAQRPVTTIAKLTSRINHSCSLNTIISWDIASLALFVTAVHDIPAGVEISVRYREPLLPSAQCQQFLRANYGFTCACADPAVSDARRARIMQGRHLLDDRDATLVRWIGDAALPDDHLTAPLRTVLALIAEEGVQDSGMHPMTLKLLVDAYAAYGDAERLAEYAARFVVARAGTIHVAPRRRQAMVHDLSRPGLYPFWSTRMEYQGRSAARG